MLRKKTIKYVPMYVYYLRPFDNELFLFEIESCKEFVIKLTEGIVFFFFFFLKIICMYFIKSGFLVVSRLSRKEDMNVFIKVKNVMINLGRESIYEKMMNLIINKLKIWKFLLSYDWNCVIVFSLRPVRDVMIHFRHEI